MNKIYKNKYGKFVTADGQMHNTRIAAITHEIKLRTRLQNPEKLNPKN